MKIRSNTVKKPSAVPPPSIQEAPVPQIRRTSSKKWLIVVLVLFAFVGWWVWDRFLRTSAYAIVEVDEIQISSPLTGLVDSMSVKEDGEYEAGTIVFTIVDRDSRDKLEALQLQLRVIESQMAEKSMSLKLTRADRLYERDDLIAEHRADLGKACFEREQLSAEIAKLSAELPLRQFNLRRAERLARNDAVAEQELVVARTEYESAS